MLLSQFVATQIPAWALIAFVCGVSCTPSPISTGNQISDNENTTQNQGETGLSDTIYDTLDIVSFDKWTILDDQLDPYPDHKMFDHNCDPKGVLAEDEVLEINTNDCSYAIVGQPLAHDVLEGDWL